MSTYKDLPRCEIFFDATEKLSYLPSCIEITESRLYDDETLTVGTQIAPNHHLQIALKSTAGPLGSRRGALYLIERGTALKNTRFTTIKARSPLEEQILTLMKSSPIQETSEQKRESRDHIVSFVLSDQYEQLALDRDKKAET